ncbi:hypothetical protein PINS_up020877 [Pythium insidiosum]|nr:hypothetical protein PINS_up020877 [Pythium insidiosum]
MIKIAGLLNEVGATLTMISLSIESPGRSHEVLEMAAQFCRRLSTLSIIDVELEVTLVESLAATYDAGSFQLRKLSIGEVYRPPNVAGVSLLQILSDPHRPLVQTLHHLNIRASAAIYSAIDAAR